MADDRHLAFLEMPVTFDLVEIIMPNLVCKFKTKQEFRCILKFCVQPEIPRWRMTAILDF